MKSIKIIYGFLFLLSTIHYSLSTSVYAVNLTAQNIAVLDINGNSRTTFTSSEYIVLRQQVNNTVQSANMIQFKFYILNPSGSTVFTHTGNAAPGTPGMSQSQISGLAINRFYSSPGYYTFKAETVLDSETVVQELKFSISSPNITLIYPPDGSRDLSDKPLIFRWVASGASKYKITVSDNAGLYNPILTYTNAGESSYTYPENPVEPRQQLVPGQVYYWKVEGLDAYNNKISDSNIYSFSLKSQSSSQSKNVLVSNLEMTTPDLDFKKPLNFKVTALNSGGTNESNIAVKLTLGGMPAQDSPKTIQFINSGGTKEIPFTAFAPQDQEDVLAVACIDLFDDNIPDNCKTKLISKGTVGSVSGGASDKSKKLTYDEMWEAVKQRLGPDALKALEGYTFSAIECPSCGADDLNDIIAALIAGNAQIANASIVEAVTYAPSVVSQSPTATEETSAEVIEEMPEIPLEIPDAKPKKTDEWSGYSSASMESETAFFTIRDKKEWKKIWKKFSGDDLPDVDFGNKIVLGIVSGKKDRADMVRILSHRKTAQGVQVDYYIIEQPKGKKLDSSFYIFKAVGKEEGEVKFKRLDITK